MSIDLGQKVKWAKQECLKLCVNAGIGHVTSAFSCAEIVATLYYEIMQIDPHDPHWEDRDRFVMSKNHGSVITYPILADLGYTNFSEIETFLKVGSSYGAHSKMQNPGVDFAGGALGIGIGVACGMAYAAKQAQKSWLTFCIVGDGECYEGSVWEAALFAGHYQLNDLILIVDRNKLCLTSFTEKMLALEPLEDKFRAFGWEVRTINGHALPEIKEALSDVRNRQSKKPLCVIANTVKGHGIDFMENEPFWHGLAPSGEKAERAFAQVEGRD